MTIGSRLPSYIQIANLFLTLGCRHLDRSSASGALPDMPGSVKKNGLNRPPYLVVGGLKSCDHFEFIEPRRLLLFHFSWDRVGSLSQDVMTFTDFYVHSLVFRTMSLQTGRCGCLAFTITSQFPRAQLERQVEILPHSHGGVYFVCFFLKSPLGENNEKFNFNSESDFIVLQCASWLNFLGDVGQPFWILTQMNLLLLGFIPHSLWRRPTQSTRLLCRVFANKV